jgi:hypothetical protein
VPVVRRRQTEEPIRDSQLLLTAGWNLF